MSEPKVVAKNVTMYPEHWEVIEAIDNRYGFRNTSTALRFIISEYQRMTDEAVVRVSNGDTDTVNAE